MSFLPGSLTPALLRSCHRKVISHSDGHLVVGCRRKQKEPITQSTKNRREHSSRFKVMFYVIGSENSKSGSASYSSSNRTKGVVEQFGTSGVPIPCRMIPTYGGTLVFSCTTIIQIHHLSVKFLNVSHYIRNFKEQFSTETKKDPSTG